MIAPKRTDANHSAIVQALRQVGAVVLDVHALPGCLDLLVAYRGALSLLEVKDGAKPAHARRLAEARVKAVTGQDPITCRFLWAQLFTYVPTYKLWMAMNHKPTIRGTDRGIWRRIKLIPFTQNFEANADKQLAATLHGELPGILNWALAGLHDWITNGLGTAAVVEAATEEYRKESDLVGQWFEDCAASSPASTTPAAEAYDSFRTWCKNWGYREPNQNSFSRQLTERGYHRLRERGKRQWQGFIILDLISGSES